MSIKYQLSKTIKSFYEFLMGFEGLIRSRSLPYRLAASTGAGV